MATVIRAIPTLYGESKAMLASALPSRDGGRLYVKRMADFFGHSNDLITLSLSQVLTYNSLYIINLRGHPR